MAPGIAAPPVAGVPNVIPLLVPGALPFGSDPPAPTTGAATPTVPGLEPASANGTNTEVTSVAAMEAVSSSDMVTVAGGVGGLMLAGVLAGAFTYRGASAQQRRIESARAEFFGTGGR
jgi:hypothetical protein